MPSSTPIADVAPLLRGWLHLVCAIASLPAGALVVSRADEAGGRTGALVYAFGMFLMFTVSALYHRVKWSPAMRPWMKRADHAAIFVMIAASYSPLCLVVLRPGIGPWLLAGVWVAAVVGVAGAITGVAEKAVIGLVSYSVLGWAAVLAVPDLVRRLDPIHLVLLFAGGVLYTVGSIFLGLRWPKPNAKVFGYHEVWHVLVVVAVACHFAVVWSVVG